MLEIKQDTKVGKHSDMNELFRKEMYIRFLQVTLTTFNILYWVLGMTMLCAGLWAVIELHKYVDLPPEMSGTGPYLMIGLGIFTLISSSFAFSCISKEQSLLIYIYGACLVCIFMMNVGVFISVSCYREALYKGLYDGLMRTIQNYNPDTTNFDFAQSTFQCCGVSNYTDWIRSSPMKVIPTSCCVDPTTCVTANYSDVYSKGCYNVIQNYIQTNMPILICASGAVGIMPLLGSRIAFLLAKYTARHKIYNNTQHAAYFT